MKILVTGATGFLGKKLSFRLVELGHQVTGIGRNASIGEELKKGGVRFLNVSLEDRKAMLKVCEGMDYIFHCGALSSPWGTYEEFYKSNVTGTKNIIEGCQFSQVKRLIHVSTPSLYFSHDERTDVKENDAIPQRFVNDYAKTKHLAEEEIRRAHREGLPVIGIRPRAIFGPGDNAILPRLIHVCEKGKFPRMSHRPVEMDITYVENVVDALLLCMDSPSHTLGEFYNITNDERVDLYEILEEVMGRLGKTFVYKHIPYPLAFTLAKGMEWVSRTFRNGKEPLLTTYTVSVLSKSQTLNIDKAKKELGYTPKVSIREGMDRFAEWWEKQ